MTINGNFSSGNPRRLQIPTEAEVNSIPRSNPKSTYGTWDPSHSNFEVRKLDPFNSNMSQYSDSKPNRDLYSILSHPEFEDEFLSLINAAFDSRAFIPELE